MSAPVEKAAQRALVPDIKSARVGILNGPFQGESLLLLCPVRFCNQ